MKITKILGKKVLDCDANDIGKISDVDLDIIDNSIKSIFINSSELSLRKVIYEVIPSNVSQVGDYILLNISKSELVDLNSDSEDVPDVEIVNPNEIEEKNRKNN